jgi:hypothetical protein
MPRSLDPRVKITEKQFQSTVIQIAKWYGWLVFHPMPVQNTKGVWRTAVAGDIGFPDLVLAHSTRGLILAELKTGIGRVSDDQQLWIDTLLLAGAETYVWRPKDLPEIEQRLKGR